ncbi:MAG: SLBB domain-containing protein, partial [Armatimonadota bacterium]
AKTQALTPTEPLLTTPLSPADQLLVRVYSGDLKHVEVTVAVSDTLTISLPPLGAVSVKDLTLLTLRDALLRRYRLFYPRCAVEVLLLARGGVTVKPGQLQPTGPETPAWQKLPPEVTVTEILTSLPRFGASVFGPQTASGGPGQAPAATHTAATAGLPVTNAPVPADYQVGPGDQLVIRNWTAAVENYNGQVAVAPEGSVYLPLLGEVPLAGQNLAQVTSRLASRFAKFFRGAQTTVTIVAPRSVEVYVTGDAVSPGKYTFSGTATVFTALFAAGGPSPIGSLRNIRLSRKGQPSQSIDLYPYLLTGERDQDLSLNPGDTIFIGPSAASIGISGLVRRPALYEINAGISISEALKLAAGLDPRGYAPNIEVWRVSRNTAWNVVNVDLNGAKGEVKGPDFQLQNGDLVLVRPVLEKPANTIEVIGAVRQPGTYEVGTGMDVESLLKRAQGLEENAYMGQAAVWRLTPAHDYKMLRFSVQKALAKQQPDNLALLPGDKLYIYAREAVLQSQQVSVAGAVASPGVFPWAEELRVSDLLLGARGLVPGAYTARADLQRLTAENKQQIIAVSLTRILGGDPEADLALLPGDLLTVYTQADMGVATQVTVSGHVQRPGVYERKEGMKASDLVHEAGGLLPGAATEVEYTKGRTTGAPQVLHLQLTERDGKFVLEPDVVLGDDDNLAVMATGDFNAQPRMVTVQGQVAHPGTYALLTTATEPDTVYKLLKRAGLLLSDANPRGIVLFRVIDSDARTPQKNDVGQVLKSFNRETAGTQPTLSGNSQTSALSNSIAKQFGSVFSGSRGEAVVVIPPRALTLDAWASAVPIEGEKLVSTAGKEGDMPLQPGDTVMVPTMPTTVAVLGAAVRPGAVRYQGPLTPRQYVDLAGGPATDASLGRLVVIRANGAVFPSRQVREIQAGDVIVVPSDFMVRQLGGPNGLQRFLETITAVATAFILKY